MVERRARNWANWCLLTEHFPDICCKIGNVDTLGDFKDGPEVHRHSGDGLACVAAAKY